MAPGGILRREVRATFRYSLGAPVKYRWLYDGRMHQGEGVTRDISPDGMFIWCPNKPPPRGVSIDCEVRLPRTRLTRRALELRISGYVVRNDGPKDGVRLSGFALTGERSQIRIIKVPLKE